VNTLDTSIASLKRIGLREMAAKQKEIFDVVLACQRAGQPNMSLTEIKVLPGPRGQAARGAVSAGRSGTTAAGAAQGCGGAGVICHIKPPHGRPPGEVRQALFRAAWDLCRQGAGVTVQELAEHARVGRAAAHWTVRNLVSSGVLQQVGQARADNSNRPVRLYAPAGLERKSFDFSGLQRVW